MSSRALKLLAVSASFLTLACGGEDAQEQSPAAELGSTTQAMHSWNGYHWGRTSNPFQLKLGDNVSAAWDSALSLSSSDWSKSTVLDTSVVAGQARPKNCRPTAGRVEVCNAAYGNTGWLGVAQIWLSGGHISQGIVKVNDTYYNTAKYNTPAWRNSVMCQEIGHTLGLGHNDEDFDTVNGTCMDYANDPTQNQHPDSHDYAELESIYRHLDGTTTVGMAVAPAPALPLDTRNEWGREVSRSADGHHSTFVREFGPELMVVTEVRWANE
ncbi:MAG TPA: hypothetical protein VFO83_17080 [Aggregicoccus sp.]|nr:hypothetical protein [Aggregicoccus sp.]